MTRILVAEDDQLIGETLKNILVNQGYAVDWQKHGETAKQSIKDNKYHLAMLDSNLPKISGLELLKLIRTQDKKMPVMILTAQSTYQNQLDYMKAGASSYITKPFDIDTLIEQIESFITHP